MAADCIRRRDTIAGVSELRDDRQRARVAGVLLAAGGSSRMGTPKQLLNFEGQSLVRRAARALLASMCDKALAVIGANAEAVRAELADLSIQCVIAENWAQGMSHSIRCGIQAVAPDFDAALITLADQPDITPDHLDALISAYRTGRALAVATTYADTRGVPALFGSALFPKLTALVGDRGARDLLRDGADVDAVQFEPAARDIDRGADLP